MGTYNSQNVVDPAVPNSKGNKAKDNCSNRDAKSDHRSPDTHVPSAFPPEEGLCNDTTANCGSRTNEEPHNGSAKGHGCVVGAVCATDVTDKADNEGDKKDGPAAKSLGQRAPDKRSSTQDGDDERC